MKREMTKEERARKSEEFYERLRLSLVSEVRKMLPRPKKNKKV